MALRAERTRRGALTKEAVLRAAIALADKDGIEALSMRRLAQHLGVEAMSLYHYVKGKDELLDGMVDVVVGEIASPRGTGDWKAELRRSALSAHDVLSRHAWAAGLMHSRAGGEALPRWMETLLAALRRGGLSPETTDHAYHALDSYIVGFTLWHASFQFEKRDLAALARSFFEQRRPDEYPYLIEHMAQHMRPRKRGVDFEFGLDLILDGLERSSVRRPARRR